MITGFVLVLFHMSVMLQYELRMHFLNARIIVYNLVKASPLQLLNHFLLINEYLPPRIASSFCLNSPALT